MLSKNKTGWLLLSPTILILVLAGLVPFFYVLYVGFFQWNPLAVDPSLQFDGFASNYRRLIFDEIFLESIWRSIKFSVVTLSIELTLGFLLALSLLSSFPLKSFFRSVHTLPLVIAPIVVGSIFKLFTVQGLGPLPHILKDYFGYTLNYGLNAEQAFWMIVIMDVWHWTPFVTLTLLAGLSALPQDPYESAKIDGANNFQIFNIKNLSSKEGQLKILQFCKFPNPKTQPSIKKNTILILLITFYFFLFSNSISISSILMLFASR